MTDHFDIYDLTCGLGAFGVSNPGTRESCDAAGTECLLDFWAQAIAEERALGAPAPQPYDLALERLVNGGAVESAPFLGLPYGLQRILGGSATDALYAARVDQPLATEIERFAATVWTRETVPVRSLATHALNPWARTQLWPGIRPRAMSRAAQQIPIAYSELVRGAPQAAPVILYGDALHEASVPYLVALLRFAPNSEVRVLRAHVPHGGPRGLRPEYRPWDWNARGTTLLDRDTPVASSEREMQFDRRQFQVAAQRDGAWGGRLPYYDRTPSLAVQTAWRDAAIPHRVGRSGRRLACWLPFAIAGEAERHRRVHAVLSWSRAAATYERHPLRDALPEYGRAIGRLAARIGTWWHPTVAFAEQWVNRHRQLTLAFVPPAPADDA